MTARTILMVLSVLSISACKLQITMPAVGGSVVTKSGKYNCQAGETCSIDVTDTSFLESFIAAPASGYRFVGWRKGPSLLCGGSKKSCTLSTTNFDQYPDLLAILDSDTIVKLEPIFRLPATPDYNGDGYADLLMAAPREEFEGTRRAGIVHALYGSANGPDAGNQQTFNLDTFKVGSSTVGDLLSSSGRLSQFGEILASGDFNNDGYTDLAIGIQRWTPADNPVLLDSGAVFVLYGSASGLTPAGHQLWSQSLSVNDLDGDGEIDNDLGDMLGGSEGGDRFGQELAVGDFDSDGYDDLAIGVPKEDLSDNEILLAGAVNVLYGSVTGLAIGRTQFWTQGGGTQKRDDTDDTVFLGDIIGAREPRDVFGTSLTAGDFDNDGYDDLAVGSPSESIGDVFAAGYVNIIKGSNAGLTALGNEHLRQDKYERDDDGDGTIDVSLGELGGIPEGRDRFGSKLSTADFNGDGIDDLAIGVSGEKLEFEDNREGIVQVFYGTTGQLQIPGFALRAEVPVWLNPEDDSYRLVGDLRTADLNGDGYSELISTAVTFRGVEPPLQIQFAKINFGSREGLSDEAVRFVFGTQLYDKEGILLVKNSFEQIELSIASYRAIGTSAITAGDYNNDGYDDLVGGTFGESAVIFYGAVSSGKKKRQASEQWTQEGGIDDSGKLLGPLYETIEEADRFGEGLH